MADIPEGETFSQYDKYEVNTVHRRLAASAGHVYHKPVTSNESFTWLRFPRFVVTLENIKAVAGRTGSPYCCLFAAGGYLGRKSHVGYPYVHEAGRAADNEDSGFDPESRALEIWMGRGQKQLAQRYPGRHSFETTASD